jgi:hypothetical protein
VVVVAAAAAVEQAPHMVEVLVVALAEERRYQLDNLVIIQATFYQLLRYQPEALGEVAMVGVL